MFIQRLALFSLIFALIGCNSSVAPGRITVGVVSFGESDRSVEQYTDLTTYLGKELNSVIELEPTYNELKAVEQVKRNAWDIVFAPSGLAAIAISESEYTPLFPLEGGLTTRSVIVVLDRSPLKTIRQLEGQGVALGYPGSATGYYLPIYNLYGLTLSEVKIAATPKMILELVAQGKVAAGALSLAEFNRYRTSFSDVRFRILDTDSHQIPSGSILVSSTLDEQTQENIRQALADASPAMIDSAGYLTTSAAPDYNYLIEVVKRVRPIAERIKQQPAPLYEQRN